jgi:RNA polymerase sigma factor (sigma-70 family)
VNKVEEYFVAQKGRLLHYIHSNLKLSGARDAEDLLQDVMLGILEKITPSDDIANLGGYVYRSIKNRIIDSYRSSKDDVSLNMEINEEKHTLLDLMADMRYDTYQEADKTMLREKIFDALDRLNPEMKAVWCAVELESHTYQELSVLWRTPLGTLLSRKRRADMKLREMLSELRGEYEIGIN